MPIYTIQGPDGRKYKIEGPEGATADQLGEFISSQPSSVSIGKEINSFPRQLGLTARYGLEGVANAAQLVTEPLRYLTDSITPNRQRNLSDVVKGDIPPKSTPLGVQATKFADLLGLPSPQGADERVIGDAAKLGFGTLATGGAGQIAQKATGAVKELGKVLSSAPVTQVVSAAGSGIAGGSSREAGGSTMDQVVASIAGGLGGAASVSSLNSIGSKAASLKNLFMSPQKMDVKIDEILRTTGVDYSQVPEKVRQGLREELKNALRADRELDPAAVNRLLDFKRAGLTPTRGMVSLDPVQITREQNLAKVGANSGDGALHGLPLIQNKNNAKLISNLNEAGAANGSIGQAGNVVTSSVLGRRDALRGAEQAAWDAAKSSPGYRQPISSKVISDINSTLGNEGMMPFMSPQISKYMEAFQTGQPFTPQDYRNLQSMLSREIAKGGNEGHAASLAARILRESELLPSGFSNSGNLPVTQGIAASMRNADNAASESIDAINSARRATRAAYSYEDSSPLVRSVLSEGASSDPQRIAQRYVIGGTSREAQDLASQVGPQGREVIKNALLNHLKNKALSGAADEVGKFSQSAFNKELKALRESGKLAHFFSKEEIDQIESMGRAASYMQVQPVGAAVNNSNSGALLLGRGLDVLDKLPVIGPMVSPALKNVQISYGNRQASNILPGLLAEKQKKNMIEAMVAPSIAMGGLLAAPSPY